MAELTLDRVYQAAHVLKQVAIKTDMVHATRIDTDCDLYLKTTCFIANMSDFAKFNEVYAKYFISKPARSCVEAKLPKGALCEIEAIAELES